MRKLVVLATLCLSACSNNSFVCKDDKESAYVFFPTQQQETQPKEGGRARVAAAAKQRTDPGGRQR